MTPIPINVGRGGGDLAGRRFSFVGTLTLALLALPPLGLSYSTLKIASLLVAMSGTLFLIAGLVFDQKTQYSGIVLIPASAATIAFAAIGYPIGAVITGLVFSAMIGANLVTRRCGLNKMLSIDSSS